MDYTLAAEEAFARRRAELGAIPAREVLRVNLEAMDVVGVILKVEPRIRTLRSEFERCLRVFNFELADALRDCALAFYFAETVCLATARPVRCPPELLKEAKHTRARLLHFVKACAARGLVDAARWSELRGANGYRNTASDLGVLVSIVQTSPKLMEFEQTLLLPGELKRADLLGRELLVIAAKSDRRSEELSQSREMRARAFTLLMRSYNEVRRAVAYVRAEFGDADSFAPTLFTKHSHRRARQQPSQATAVNESVGIAAKPESEARAETAEPQQ